MGLSSLSRASQLIRGVRRTLDRGMHHEDSARTPYASHDVLACDASPCVTRRCSPSHRGPYSMNDTRPSGTRCPLRIVSGQRRRCGARRRLGGVLSHGGRGHAGCSGVLGIRVRARVRRVGCTAAHALGRSGSLRCVSDQPLRRIRCRLPVRHLHRLASRLAGQSSTGSRVRAHGRRVALGGEARAAAPSNKRMQLTKRGGLAGSRPMWPHLH
jgi:hypothetical protein